jgi:hypothetical protein
MGQVDRGLQSHYPAKTPDLVWSRGLHHILLAVCPKAVLTTVQCRESVNAIIMFRAWTVPGAGEVAYRDIIRLPLCTPVLSSPWYLGTYACVDGSLSVTQNLPN